jgi:hypothetical protein
MIEPELGSNGKRFPAALALGGRQENLLFHADMPEEPCTELGVSAVIDRFGTSRSRLEQSVETPVVFDKKFREDSRL